MKMPRLKDLWTWWDQIWFAPVDLIKFGLFRFVLGLIMLVMYVTRAFSFKMFFTDDGLILGSQAGEILPEFYRPPVQLFTTSPQLTMLFYAAFLILIVMIVVGIGGRISTFLALLLHLSFIQRDFPIVYGAELMISFWLLYLSLVQNNRYFSIWNLRKRGSLSRSPILRSDIFSSIGARLMMLQLCIIYGYTGLEKLKGQPWWEGSAIWSVLGNHQLMTADFTFLQNVPVLVALLTFSSLLFEVYFPVLVWTRFRSWVLVFGILFHTGIASMMGLVAFSTVMVTAYSSFVDETWLRGLLGRIRNPLVRNFIASD